MNVELERHAVLRGEHLANLLDYSNGTRLKWDESRGYSAAFAEKHDEILRDIIENPGKRVRVVAGLDDICDCGVCPKRRENCRSAELREKDTSVAVSYGVVTDRIYRSGELLDMLRKAQGGAS